jgi:hyperosmotically inducible protein
MIGRRMTTTAAAVALTMAAAMAWGAQPAWKDEQILADVARQVRQYANYTIFDDIGVSVSGGVVTLAGKVTMPYKRQDIERRARAVSGVLEVDNRITVLPASIFDDELRYRIARAIYGNPSFWNYAAMANPPIHIVVENGHVTLTGVVASHVDRMLARSLAASLGALSVTNELKTDAEVRQALEKQAS